MGELTIPAAERKRPRQAAWRERQREKPSEPGTGEYIGFIGCAKSGVLKVRVKSREKHVMEVACACGEVHMTPDPQIRERLPGEVVTLTEEGTPMAVGPPAKPTTDRVLTYISDDDFLAALGSDNKPAPVVAKALGVGGSSVGARLRVRAEWLNYDAKAERIIITRYGAPKPTLLRRADDD